MSKFLALFLLVPAILALGPTVQAAGLVPCGGSPRCCDAGESAAAGCPNPAAGGCCNTNCEPRCQLCHFFVLAQNLVNFILFTIVPPLAVLLMVIGGFLFIIGSGYDPGMIKQGKDIIQSVAMGLVILYGGWILVNTFFVFIGLADTDLGRNIRNWFQINCPI